MWSTLADIGAALPDDVRVVVVRGAGPCFSAGLDRAMFTPEGPEGEPGLAQQTRGDDTRLADQIGTWQEGFTWLARPDLFTVAAVHGYAIGGGFQLALACDVRLVAEDVQLSMKEPALGIVPDLAGTKPLVEAVGYSRAVEICATARYVGAEEAVAIGLAVRAVPVTELDAAVADLVAAVLANPAPAVRETKALLQQAPGRDPGGAAPRRAVGPGAVAQGTGCRRTGRGLSEVEKGRRWR